MIMAASSGIALTASASHLGIMLTGKTLLSAVETASHLANVAFSKRQTHEWRPEVAEVLNETDAAAKIRAVHALIQTIRKRRDVELDKDASRLEGDVIDVCLSNVHEILDKITGTMNFLHAELELHDHRWFSSWRTPNVVGFLQNLRVESTVLDRRVDLLIKCMSIPTTTSIITPP